MSVLVATDFSENAEQALRTAARQASIRNQPLVVLHCLEAGFEALAERQLSEPPQNLRAHLWKEAKDQLETLYEEAVPAGEQRPPTVDFRVEITHPKDGIVEVARDSQAELVVMGATGQSRLANVILGGTAEEVVRRIDVPVFVVHNEAEREATRRIVAPVDFTDCSRHSLEVAAEQARRESAELIILHAFVLPVADTALVPAHLPPEAIETYEQQRREHLEELVAEVDLQDVDWRTQLEIGKPYRTIADTVEDSGANLVVMGTHGRRGFERLFLGSTAAKVLRNMPTSVMTVRTLDDDTDDS
jgi:nucleotide-binding universal stress UspA family protein